MSTRNTVKTTHNSPLERVLASLETLSAPKHLAVVRFLLENGQSSLLDISIHTGFDSDLLEQQLDQLCAARLVFQRNSLVGGDRYEPNVAYLKKISAVARQLAAFYD